MSRTSAALTFLGACVILAALLLTRALSPMAVGALFAAALVVVGLLSRGFTRPR